MKSSVSFLTDSIEKQSLPSIPLRQKPADKSSNNHESFDKHTRSPGSINSNKFFSKILNYQKSFTSIPVAKHTKTPELNKINEYAVLKVFEHRNFGNSPSNYSRMSVMSTDHNLPKSRSYVHSKARFYTPSLRTHYCTFELVC